MPNVPKHFPEDVKPRVQDEKPVVEKGDLPEGTEYYGSYDEYDRAMGRRVEDLLSKNDSEK